MKSNMDSLQFNIQLQSWKTNPKKVTFPSQVEQYQKGLDVFNDRFNSPGSTCLTNKPAALTKPRSTEIKPPHQASVLQELTRGISELTCKKCDIMAKTSRLYKLKSLFWKENDRSLLIPRFLYRCDTCEKQNKENQIKRTTLRTFVDHRLHMKNIHTYTKRGN